MPTDTLQQFLTEVETFCTEHNLIPFRGELLQPENFPTCDWKKKAPDDWKSFILTAKKMGVKAINIEETLCEPDTDDFELVNEAIKSFELHQRPYFQQMVSTVKEHIGQIAECSLAFVVDNTVFTYHEQAKWKPAYKLFYTFVDMATENEDDTPSTPSLDLDAVEKAVHQITNSPEFISAESETEAHSIAYDYCVGLKNFGRLSLNAVSWRVKKAHKLKVDNEWKEKVRAIRLEKPDITKVEIIGIMGLSKHQVDKYWGPKKINANCPTSS